MALINLPSEVVNLIFRALPAIDRGRLAVAMPKRARLRCTYNDRALGVLTTALRKGLELRFTNQIRDFLRTVPKDDPTWEEITQYMPIASSVQFRPPCATLEDKIQSGQVTLDDLHDLDVEHVMFGVEMARLPVAILQAAASHPVFEALVLRVADNATNAHMFAFGLLHYDNKDLLRCMVNTKNSGTMQHLCRVICQELITSKPLSTANHRLHELVFELFDMPPEVVKQLQLHALETMNIDAAMFYSTQ